MKELNKILIVIIAIVLSLGFFLLDKNGIEKTDYLQKKENYTKTDTVSDTYETYETDKSKEKNDDKYSTDDDSIKNDSKNIQQENPKPVEPENVKKTDKKLTATLSIRCDTLLDNLDTMNPEKIELIPEDGIILPPTQITFFEGENVFDVLQRETKERKIHMEATFTPMYNSTYIEGINNLYEFDGGSLSGWMYRVNGWFPNYGASRYLLKNNDIIEWIYTCDLGKDIGGYVEE